MLVDDLHDLVARTWDNAGLFDGGVGRMDVDVQAGRTQSPTREGRAGDRLDVVDQQETPLGLVLTLGQFGAADKRAGVFAVGFAGGEEGPPVLIQRLSSGYPAGGEYHWRRCGAGQYRRRYASQDGRPMRSPRTDMRKSPCVRRTPQSQ